MIDLPEIIQDSKIVPKYQQVIDCITTRIKNGEIAKGEKLPSIFELSAYLNVSKDTVEKAYHHLNEKGITRSFNRRGYFVVSDKLDQTQKVLFIVKELNYLSKLMYEMLSSLDLEYVEFITYCYSNNQSLLESIVKDNLLEIDHFLLSPEIQEIEVELDKVIDKIPNERILLVKKGMDRKLVNSSFNGLDAELVLGLESMADRIGNYSCFNLVLPQEESYYLEIIKGFRFFCEKGNIDYQILDGIEADDIKFNQSYFIIDDASLSEFIGYTRMNNFALMEDVGVISLQDSPFKKYLEGGITTISLDVDKLISSIKSAILGQNEPMDKARFLIFNRDSI